MKYIPFLILFVLTGCASMNKGPLFTPEVAPSNNALIYIYRDDETAALEIPAPLKVLINEEDIGHIPNQSYIFTYVEPGLVDISTIPWQDFRFPEKLRVYVEIQAEPGETLYFKKTQIIGPYTVFSSLKQVPNIRALKEIKSFHKAIE
jgi:hypothetical protein